MALIERELTADRRLFLGFDFAFGYPDGFGAALTGSQDPFAVWRWYQERIEDTPKANNRFAVASEINRQLGAPLFWGCPARAQTPYLSMQKRDPATLPFNEMREVEHLARGAFPVWQLAYAGAVGSQVMMGLPVLERLRQAFPNQIAVWPFEPLDRPVAFVEVWPSLYAKEVIAASDLHPIKDAAQMHVLTEKVAAMSPDRLASALDVPRSAEGWIFGVAP